MAWISSTDVATGLSARASSAGDLEEARALSPVAASVEEIQAMTDEDVLVWRAKP